MDSHRGCGVASNATAQMTSSVALRGRLTRCRDRPRLISSSSGKPRCLVARLIPNDVSINAARPSVRGGCDRVPAGNHSSRSTIPVAVQRQARTRRAPMPELLVRKPVCGPIRLTPCSIAAMVFCAVASWDGRCSAAQPPTTAATQGVDPARFDPRVRGLVTITHVGRDRWRFAYDLSRDARSIMLGPKAEKYHATAWKLPEAFHVLLQGTLQFPGTPGRQTVSAGCNRRAFVPSHRAVRASAVCSVRSRNRRQHRPAGLCGPHRRDADDDGVRPQILLRRVTR